MKKKGKINVFTKGIYLVFLLAFIFAPRGTYGATDNKILWDTMYTDDVFKVWTISFNYDLNFDTVNSDNIYIVDENDKVLSSYYVYPGENKNSFKVDYIVGYQPYKTYTIFVEKGVQGIKGEKLKKKYQIPVIYEPSEEENVIDFPDKNLEQEIRKIIDRPDRPIHQAHIFNIRKLNLQNLEIENLEGLQYVSMLEELNLSNNKVVNLQPLSNLTRLVELDLSVNRIRDLEPLTNLISLRSLFLDSNPINDFSSLEYVYGNLIEKDFNLDELHPEPEPVEPIKISGLSIGDKVEDIIQKLGNPSRIEDSGKGYDWYIYNQDYYNYIQLGIDQDKLVAVYSSQKNLLPDYGIALGQGIDMKDIESIFADFTKVSPLGANFISYRIGNSILNFYFDVYDEQKLVGVLVEDDSYYEVYPKYNENIIRGFENQLFDLVNASRAQRGMNLYSWKEEVADVARGHSKDMALHGYVGHDDSQGKSHSERLQEAGIDYGASGENVAGIYFTPIEVHYGLLESSLHRQNIFSYRYNKAGFGVDYGTNEDLPIDSIYWTQLFTADWGYKYDYTINQENKDQSLIYNFSIEDEADYPFMVKPKEVEMVFYDDVYNFNLDIGFIPDKIDVYNKDYQWSFIIQEGDYEYEFWLQGNFVFGEDMIPAEELVDHLGGSISMNGPGIEDGLIGNIQGRLLPDRNVLSIQGHTSPSFNPRNISKIKIKNSYTEGGETFIFESILLE